MGVRVALVSFRAAKLSCVNEASYQNSRAPASAEPASLEPASHRPGGWGHGRRADIIHTNSIHVIRSFVPSSCPQQTSGHFARWPTDRLRDCEDLNDRNIPRSRHTINPKIRYHGRQTDRWRTSYPFGRAQAGAMALEATGSGNDVNWDDWADWVGIQMLRRGLITDLGIALGRSLRRNPQGPNLCMGGTRAARMDGHPSDE